jgi:autophagy-related protein 2
MAFLFIPERYQKKLFRYGLSHFPVIDTDTLDLEQLDIAWGTRSAVELRDVGLRIEVTFPSDIE